MKKEAFFFKNDNVNWQIDTAEWQIARNKNAYNTISHVIKCIKSQLVFMSVLMEVSII